MMTSCIDLFIAFLKEKEDNLKWIAKQYLFLYNVLTAESIFQAFYF